MRPHIYHHARPAAKPGRKRDIMKKFEIGQRFWDEKNCVEIEIIKSNETEYYCRTIEGASDDDAGTEGYQWFKASELNGFKPAR